MKIDFHFELMKKSIRPLLCIIVLIALGTGLSSRIAVRRDFSSPVPENEITVTRRVVHNETLLAFAAVEIGEAEWKAEIGRLLELNLGQGRSRSISSWQRDNHDIEPRSRERVPFRLLNPKYTRLWPEFQRLLRNWSRNRRFQPEIMSDLIDLVKNPLDRHFQTGDSNRSYSSCAVVGNSGILLRKEYGELIDSHEVVIRLNNARTNGYVKNVGSKTTISFVNSNILHLCARREGCFCHPYGENVPIVMYICQAVHFMDYTVCNLSHKAPLVVTDARFDVLCSRIVKYYSLKRFMETTGKDHTEWAAIHDGSMFHYSSGMQAIMLALGICEKVSLFGFGKSVEAKHHYHTNQKVELHLHDYEAEYLFYHDLINRPMSIPFLKDSGFVIPPMSIFQ